MTDKDSSNGFTKYIMAGIFGVLILASFSWTTICYFNMSTKLDNHLTHIASAITELDNKMDKIQDKISRNGERISSLESIIHRNNR